MSRKVVDCFNFCDELEVLNMRLHELNDVVDYVVLVESSITHSGLPKKLSYKENKHHFEKFNNKIIHITVSADEMLNFGRGNKSNWRRSWEQRERIREGTNQLDLKENDIILISDVDEIPNAEKVADFKSVKGTLHDRYAFLMRHFYYNFNWERLPSARTPNKGGEDASWAAARLTTYSFFKDHDVNDIRKNTGVLAGKGWRRKKYGIFDGGWHCAYFGSAEQVKRKFESWAHAAEYELLIREKGTIEHFQKRIDEGEFIFEREGHYESWEKLSAVDVENDKKLPKYKDLAYNELG